MHIIICAVQIPVIYGHGCVLRINCNSIKSSSALREPLAVIEVDR